MLPFSPNFLYGKTEKYICETLNFYKVELHRKAYTLYNDHGTTCILTIPSSTKKGKSS